MTEIEQLNAKINGLQWTIEHLTRVLLQNGIVDPYELNRHLSAGLQAAPDHAHAPRKWSMSRLQHQVEECQNDAMRHTYPRRVDAWQDMVDSQWQLYGRGPGAPVHPGGPVAQESAMPRHLWGE